MKLCASEDAYRHRGMPPTRGHDMKPPKGGKQAQRNWMPPTRGHDLKHKWPEKKTRSKRCPPHGGTT